MDLQYPGNEGELVQFPSSDIDHDQTSSPPPSPNAFSQEPDFRFSDWEPSDFDLGGNVEPIPADLDSSENDLGDEQSVPADPTEFHPLINGM
jgi:hypothetical protein